MNWYPFKKVSFFFCYPEKKEELLDNRMVISVRRASIFCSGNNWKKVLYLEASFIILGFGFSFEKRILGKECIE